MNRSNGPGQPAPMEPEEIVARALCRDDPDAATPRGPLWTTYRKEARDLIGALAGRFVTPEADPLLSALRDLVGQIEASSYFDHRGHPLELNTAFHEARDLVKGYLAV